MTDLPRLLAITPPTGAVGDECVEASVRTGISLGVLLREPGVRPAALLDPRGRLTALRTAALDAGVPVWLSCDADALDDGCRLARDAGLRGVQVRGDPGATLLERARTAWPTGVFGRSVHGAPSSGDSWDYDVFAPVFAPRTATVPAKQPVGIDALTDWCAVGRRVFALGGITPASAPACVAAGAWGLAGISTFLGTTDAVADTLQALAAVAAIGSAARHVPPPKR